jgi:hypothetical protein
MPGLYLILKTIEPTPMATIIKHKANTLCTNLTQEIGDAVELRLPNQSANELPRFILPGKRFGATRLRTLEDPAKANDSINLIISGNSNKVVHESRGNGSHIYNCATAVLFAGAKKS